ncbi:pyridoxamine 5'-phosphate oxidase family protein [Selenihalanaerobacter shriftii]|uniref:Pyridoxamine 5'-phosphate oxidase n=1 Tax=Selenihalanaerobacter shriftii TaxID=142842 RepID=A0A1T4NYB6_9FIRM|nr:pyridoxamine 5'-phosphate oxidase family protein [Selenihalanaerobacter shriftii]SJZ84082.1 Pyridoxamine 5'-phosphate oxidase [Selenihalanaerobacter shriftii]
MIQEKILQVLESENVVAIATQGEKGPHLVNTWNSYIHIIEDDRLIFPAGGMETTENNVKEDENVLMTLGSREVEGFNGPGTGFLIEGTAEFKNSGEEFELISENFPWARAAVVVTIDSITQTL